MNIAVKPDGRSLDTLPTLTQPGDFITFRAEMECIVAFSACPQDIVKIQGQADNTPRNAHFSILENGDYPALPVSQAWIPG